MNIRNSFLWIAVWFGLHVGALSSFSEDPVQPIMVNEEVESAALSTKKVEVASTNALESAESAVVDAAASSNAVMQALADQRSKFIGAELVVYQALVDSYSEKHPIYKKGDALSITRPNGIVTGGKFKSLTKRELVLLQGTFENKVLIKDLQVGDRLRLDSAFRSLWLQMESRTLTRKALEEQGEVFPDYNLSVKVQLENALENADPKACYLMAESYRVGLRQGKDNGYVFLYNFMASKQGHVDARYDLGRMYYGAISVLRNKRKGLQLISSAGADGHLKAEAFLAKHKVGAEAMKQAALAYREQQLKDAALHAAQVERFNIANESKTVDRSRRGVSIGK